MIKLWMEFSELKIKCGSIWARSALSSWFASWISLESFSASFFRIASVRNLEKISIPMIPTSDMVVMNHHLLQNGGRTRNEKEAGSLFHKPSLLQETTLNEYFPGERFE